MTSDDDGLAQRELVRRGYDELAETYAAEREGNENDALLDRLRSDAPPGRVLDAGCGDGTSALSPLAGERPVAGLDFSREQATRANEVAPGRVVQGDMTALPFADGTFAAVGAFYSIIHVPAGETPTVYEEFARVLSPGGVALVTTGTEGWAGRNDDWLAGGAPMEWDILGLDRSTGLLEAAGFTVYETVGVVDGLGQDGKTSRLVAADSDEAEKLFIFARLES
ncbi:class I SAM-dependent methyltransferase [Haloarchaeobius iranensis]|uniref:Methyltransferase domain-containing protein n=1 Tax=Haloarchaeobius iranensis TaxID=996166 RepID=A0A1G9TTY5_9EURY|nr:class I SAM-dependent methyltransferase [Haloarchaeobius iranensis]SDM51028.1 Methyltransferase domain-containing protein [Haloarchaeobius iranensis]